jgi:iron(III) transport system substrate-binding protein
LAFGITDTDDAMIEVEKGLPIAIVYPDQGEYGMGTLFIPNTLAVIKGGPNREPAHRLVDYLLSPTVEEKLAAGPSAQIPLISTCTDAQKGNETLGSALMETIT